MTSPVSETNHHYLVICIAGFRDQYGNIMFGLSCCCAHIGSFIDLECFTANKITTIPDKIMHLVSQCKEDGYSSGSMVIYLYDNMGSQFLSAIKSILSTITAEAPIYLVIIDALKRNSRHAFQRTNRDLMPLDSCLLELEDNNYLLFVNDYQKFSTQPTSNNFPLPIKFSILQLNQFASSNNAIHDIINQIYRFSYLFQVEENQHPVPITVHFTKQLTKLAATPNMVDIPSPANTHKVWFL